MSSRDRAIGLALAVPLAAAIVFSWVRVVAEGFDDVDDAAYDAAIEQIGAGPDSAIALLPPWSVRPLQHFGGDASNVIGSDGPWFALADARYRRLTVLVEPDAEPWLAQLPAPSGKKDIGPLALFHYELHGPARYDFRAHVDEARVEGGSAKRAWALVTENGADVVVVSGAVVVSFDAVDVGREFVVAAGHARDGVDKGGVVTLTIQIDGTTVATLRRAPSFVVEPSRAALRDFFVKDVDDDGEGFRVSVVDTSAFAGGRHVVSFAVSGDVDGGFGFDAVAR